MNRRQLILIIFIAFFVGAAGSVVFGRFLIPFFSKAPKLGWLAKLETNAPIIINRTERLQLNEGINLIELSRQVQNVTVGIFRADQPKFLGNGILLTNDGVIFTTKSIAQAGQLKVMLTNGNVFETQVASLDPMSELAVIKIEASNLPVAQLSDASNLQNAQRVFAIGLAQQEFTKNFTTGFVVETLANRASVDGVKSTGFFNETIKTDADFSPEFLGSALFDLEGRIVGIVLDASGKVLVSENLQTALKSFLQKGKITRVNFGIEYLNVSEPVKQLLGLPQKGILVKNVLGGAAKQAGMVPGDIIQSAGNADFAQSSFERWLNEQTAGEVTVRVWRNGQALDIKLNLQEL